MHEITELYKQMMSEVSQAKLFAQKGLDMKKCHTSKSMEYIAIAQKKLDEVDALHKIAQMRIAELEKNTDEEIENNISVKVEQKVVIEDKSKIWEGAHEVAVRSYNEVKYLIALYKQPNI